MFTQQQWCAGWSLLVTILFPTDMLAMFDDLKGMREVTILERACRLSNASKNLTVIKGSFSKEVLGS